MNNEQQALLRAPFPAEQIGKLKMSYGELDFVSHAYVTDRLLEVDPQWTWEPAGFDEFGLPKFDEHGGLWIKLTVCGVTRYGYGEPQGSDKFDLKKGSIGNALRNAAMRFGVALDLWEKETPVATKPTQAKPVQTENKQVLELLNVIKACGSIVELAQVATRVGMATGLNDKEKDALRFAWDQRKKEIG